ncbi:hypothetical protein ACHAQA_010078 [Verticillium albo-atrum]
MAPTSGSINKSKKNDLARAEKKARTQKMKQDLHYAQEKQKKAQNDAEKEESQKRIQELETLLSNMSKSDRMDIDEDENEDEDRDPDEEDKVKKEEAPESGGGKLNAPEVKKNTDQDEAPKAEQKDLAADSHLPNVVDADQKGHDATQVKRVKKVNIEDEALFVPTNEVRDDDDQEELDEDGEKALFVRHIPKHGDQFETVGWGTGKSGTFYINRQGKKGASKYRLESLAESAEYEDREKNDEDPHKVTNSENRYGDKKLPNGKWKYTKRHIIGIWGVAWECPVGCMDDLDLINPDQVDKWPTTYVLIMWDIGGERKKVWETRSSLRSRWTKKGADAAIYEAACEAEDRHIEAETGMRPASSRSPSRDLAETTTARFRAQSHDTNNAGKVRFQVDKDVNDLSKALQAFKISYGELYGKPFQQMNVNEKADMVSAWQVQKAEIVGY